MKSAAARATGHEKKRYKPFVFGDNSVDGKTFTEFLKRLSAMPLLDREEEHGHAVDLAETREAFAALFLGLPREVRRRVLADDSEGPRNPRKWPLERLETCYGRLQGLASGPVETGVAASLHKARRLKRRLDRSRDMLVRSNLRFVVHITKEFNGRGTPLMDLVQEGTFGLFEAIDRFEHERGLRFVTYASWWIKRSILLALEGKSSLIRLPSNARRQLGRLGKVREELSVALGRQATSQEVATEMDVPLRQVDRLFAVSKKPQPLEELDPEDGTTQFIRRVSDPASPDPLKKALGHETRNCIQAALRYLDDRERRVIGLRFGIEGGRRHTLREVGRLVRLSRERVRQIERIALSKLRGAPEVRGLGKFSPGPRRPSPSRA